MVGLFLQSRRAARRGEAELEALRATVRPRRPGPARPLRPRREVGTAATAGPTVGEPG
jgi:hypothetical protein